jgi:2-polyprenyl-3-methyl-5-hydroxy-6-metoxy-1,4-benzoquinol methylase
MSGQTRATPSGQIISKKEPTMSNIESNNKITLDNPQCRLCGGNLLHRFNITVLRKYTVPYYECEKCLSLQTEQPYWLDEAYNHLSGLDTGAAQRNIHNLAACYTLSRLFNFKNVIDIGGGDGLLCRLLRDYDINCFVKDKYAKPTYAQGFTEPDFVKPDFIIALEVFEHFSNPITDLEQLFGYNANALLVSTGIYNNQTADWWYLAPEGGQHVFFYSEPALLLIAKRYDYELIISGGFILFIRKALLTPVKTVLAKLALKSLVCRLTKAGVFLLPARGSWKDHLSLKDNG